MRSRFATLVIIAGILFFTPSYAAEIEPIACAELSSVPNPAGAFDAFCARCHNPQKLSNAYFGDSDGRAADRRETELAAFLNRHSACPHRHHEEIAAWLRQLSPH